VSILVVDDEPVILLALVDLLEDAGYEARVASNGREALLRMAETPPDLVLMDIMMPSVDGREVVRRMRDDPRLRSVPVILMSAAITPDMAELNVAFLPKPFDVDDVLDLLAQRLGNRRHEAE
jgi:CheY-like chemotaxis protein